MNFRKVGLSTICLLLLWMVGCSSSQNEINGYKKSGINDEIPVPTNAESGKVKFDNSNIKKGEKYSLKNIGGEQGLYPPHEYFEEIKDWGWEELQSEQMGHIYFFKKGNTIISLEIKEDYFHLYEMEEEFDLNQEVD